MVQKQESDKELGWSRAVYTLGKREPAAQKGMENAAAATLPAARAEAVHTPMPMFHVAANPARPRRSRETSEAGGMSILILPRFSLTLDSAPAGWSPSLQGRLRFQEKSRALGLECDPLWRSGVLHLADSKERCRQ